jgi:hypothetical protein
MASNPCVSIQRNGKPCRVKAARYSVDGEAYCGGHLPLKECSVCLENCQRRGCLLLDCGHRFHTECIRRWM